MCTLACPCNIEDAEPWMEVTADELVKYGRKGVIKDAAAAGAEVPGSDLSLVFLPSVNDVGKTYSTWFACYEEMQAGNGNAKSKEKAAEGDYQAKMAAFTKTGALSFLKDFEDSFSCGSMCAKPLFYITKPVADGPVERSCSRAMLEDASGNTPAAIVAALSAILLFVGGFGAFPLCSDFKGKKEE